MTKQERIERMKADFERMTVMERSIYKDGNRNGSVKYIAGIDEVGRGPLAGPVVAAAVILPEDFEVLGVNDSKKLSEKRREELYEIIMRKAVSVGIGLRDNWVIDEINILEATKEAMLQAVNELEIKPEHLLIDALNLDKPEIPQTAVIKGDASSISIAAASIIAKVTRDRMMIEYSKQYPDYAFERNKGYGTAAHYEGLDRAGISDIHRRSFLVKYMERIGNRHYFKSKNSDKSSYL